MEVWDAYKEDGSLAGCDLIRGESIPDGLYHLISDILVRHVDGSYLLMQRDWEKEIYPGRLEATASGSVLKGETLLNGTIRELKEETGITPTVLLTQIGNLQAYDDGTIFYQFLCITDCDKSSVTLQEGETISYKWLSEDEFIKFVNSDECMPRQKDRLTTHWDSIRCVKI